MPNQYTLTGATPQAFQQGMFQPNPMYPNMPYQSLGQQYSPFMPPVSQVYANPWMPLGGMPFAVPPPNMQSPGQFPYYGYPWQQTTGNQVQPNPGNMVQQNPGNDEQPQLGNQVLPIPPQHQLNKTNNQTIVDNNQL